MRADTKDRHVYINVTEIRGMPLIIIEAYQALFILLCLVFLRWMIFAIEHTCKRHRPEEIVATAHPVRRWLSEAFSPTTRGSSSYFSDDDPSIESKEDEPGPSPIGTPTAAEILPTDGLRSYG
jgi:hypothetical protein